MRYHHILQREGNKLIVVRFTSGLGNQMFQYNLYRLLTEKYPQTEVKADVTWFYTDDEHHGFELLRIFDKVPGSDFSLDIATTAQIYSVSGQIPTPVKGPLARPVRYLLGPVNRKLREAKKPEKCGVTLNHLEQKIDYETLCNLDIEKNYYIFGYFIEEEFYRDRTPQIKKELVFPELTGRNAQIARKMERENSVSIHVRRGDYLSKTYSGQFLCLDMDYYRPAVEAIRDRIEDPVFYIFSEDAEYVRQAFDWLPEKVVIDHNTGNDSYMDMQLMSKCKANIIANSTFSQLASILNENTDHITVYPSKYMRDEDTQVRTMPGWIRI